MDVGFETIVSYLPRETLAVASHYAYLAPALAQLPEHERAAVQAHAPQQVRRLKDVSAAEHMAVAAALEALRSAQLQVSDIDGLLVAQTGGKQYMPLLGSYVHLNTGLPKSILVRNLVDGHLGAIQAANLAWSYVRSGVCRRVLIVVVGAQIGGQTKFGVDLTDPRAQWFGDGAAAAVVSAQQLQCRFTGYHCETHAVRSRPGGTLVAQIEPVRPLRHPELASAAGMENAAGAYLALQDDTLRQVTQREHYMSQALQQAVRKAGLTMAGLSAVLIPHLGELEAGCQADLRHRGLPEGLCQSARQTLGCTGVADAFLSLVAQAERGISPGAHLALWSVTAGVQNATLLLQWA